MDFKRIEVIFIVAFAILNAYLFGTYWQYHAQSSMASSTKGGENAMILKEMRNDQITYMPLSNKKNSGYYATAKKDTTLKSQLKSLSGQTARIDDNNNVVSTLKRSIAIDLDNPSKVLNTFVKSSTNVIDGTQYHYNSRLSNDDEIVYTQYLDQRPIFDRSAHIVFRVSGSKVTGYTQGHLIERKQLRQANELISQTRAVTWLYQYNEIQNNSKIQWASLGYTKLLNSENGVVYVPTWVIGVRDKSASTTEVKRINALSGVVIKNNQS